MITLMHAPVTKAKALSSMTHIAWPVTSLDSQTFKRILQDQLNQQVLLVALAKPATHGNKVMDVN